MHGVEELLGRPEARFLGDGCHLFDADALGKGHLIDRHGVFDRQFVHDQCGWRTLFQAIVTRTEPVLDAHEADEEFELAAGLDHAKLLEVCPDISGRAALCQRVIHLGARCRLWRCRNDVGAQHITRRACDEITRAQCRSDDDGDAKPCATAGKNAHPRSPVCRESRTDWSTTAAAAESNSPLRRRVTAWAAVAARLAGLPAHRSTAVTPGKWAGGDG